MSVRAARHAAAGEPYRDHFDHLEDAFRVLDRRLHNLVGKIRAERGGPAAVATGWGQGMFIGDEELDALLPPPSDGRTLIELRDDLSRRVAASLDAGVELPLVELGRIFNLSAWEQEVLLLCLAPDANSRYERILAYVQDDLSRRRPTADLALDLLGPGLADRARGRVALSAEATLRRAALIVPAGETTGSDQREAGLLRVDERIASILLGDPQLPRREWLQLLPPSGDAPGELARGLAEMVRGALAEPSGRLTVCLNGGTGSAAKLLAEDVCLSLDCSLLVVDLALVAASPAGFESSLRQAVREALLLPAAVLVLGADTLGEQRAEAEFRLAQLRAALEDFAWLAFVSSRHPIRVGPGSRGRWLTIETPAPEPGRLERAWRAELTRSELPLADADCAWLAERFRLAHTDIAAVVASARLSAGTKGATLRLADIEAACREFAGAELAGLAQRLSPRYGWDDIVLAADQLRQLHEIEAAARSRQRVLVDWGFGRKLSRGRGLSALFSGASGTGKTMAAEIIAGRLGFDLYTVDLAAVVSKYIGETEKNLSKIFEAAEATGTVLFFDEADALFGKRSEVKDAHDRYANIEVSYLLQRMETHDGLIVLATNLKRNLDEALLRRLSFSVDFAFPGPDERSRIWRRVVPEEAPLAADVDWELLGERFPLAGGSIRTAALNAAYQAAAGGEPIGMRHLLLGVRREVDKSGRAPSAADFGAYWDEVGPS
jgi:hypothetical protein